MAAILSRPQCVNVTTHHPISFMHASSKVHIWFWSFAAGERNYQHLQLHVPMSTSITPKVKWEIVTICKGHEKEHSFFSYCILFQIVDVEE